MQFAIVLVVVVFLFAALVFAALLSVVRNRAKDAEDVERLDDDEVLSYPVPVGQDPAAVLAALRNEGYEAVLEGSEITVACPAGADRERARVRAVITNAPLDMEGDPSPTQDVQFPDEQPGKQPGEHSDEQPGERPDPRSDARSDDGSGG